MAFSFSLLEIGTFIADGSLTANILIMKQNKLDSIGSMEILTIHRHGQLHLKKEEYGWSVQENKAIQLNLHNAMIYI